uniref:Uncharacterized protein n=1 Tax=Anguilla anguilla TaxID=7936 RepID=A0A0E9X2H1_ANGAN
MEMVVAQEYELNTGVWGAGTANCCSYSVQLQSIPPEHRAATITVESTTQIHISLPFRYFQIVWSSLSRMPSKLLFHAILYKLLNMQDYFATLKTSCCL